MTPKRYRMNVLPAVALAVGTSSAAVADTVSDRRSSEERYETKREGPASRSFQGTVIDTKLVTLIDRKTQTREQHLLAKLNVPNPSGDDRVGIVDLGPVSRIRATGVEIVKNGSVEGEGVRGRINDKPVLVALNFSANGTRVEGRSGE